MVLSKPRRQKVLGNRAMIKITTLLGHTKVMSPHAGKYEYLTTYEALEARVQAEDHARNFDKSLVGYKRRAKWLESREGK